MSDSNASSCKEVSSWIRKLKGSGIKRQDSASSGTLESDCDPTDIKDCVTGEGKVPSEGPVREYTSQYAEAVKSYNELGLSFTNRECLSLVGSTAKLALEIESYGDEERAKFRTILTSVSIRTSMLGTVKSTNAAHPSQDSRTTSTRRRNPTPEDYYAGFTKDMLKRIKDPVEYVLSVVETDWEDEHNEQRQSQKGDTRLAELQGNIETLKLMKVQRVALAPPEPRTGDLRMKEAFWKD